MNANVYPFARTTASELLHCSDHDRRLTPGAVASAFTHPGNSLFV